MKPWRSCGHSIPVLAAGIPPLDRLEKGGIIGLVKITDCVRRHPSRFFVGTFGFVMERPYPLPFKPMRGMLGIFNTNANGEPEALAGGHQ